MLLVVPRFGTVSPWSSKATDIAHVCGLADVVRIERGVAYFVQSRAAAGCTRSARRSAALVHDRMTESVLDSVEAAAGLFAHHAPQPLATVPVLGAGPRALERANAELGLALSDDEIDYLVAAFTRPAAPRPDRRRTDDVRAGELGALPPQDLQRRLDRRRRARAPSRCSA